MRPQPSYQMNTKKFRSGSDQKFVISLEGKKPWRICSHTHGAHSPGHWALYRQVKIFVLKCFTLRTSRRSTATGPERAHSRAQVCPADQASQADSAEEKKEKFVWHRCAMMQNMGIIIWRVLRVGRGRVKTLSCSMQALPVRASLEPARIFQGLECRKNAHREFRGAFKV